ncbi:MAG: FHA domain-containing protein [Acidobacteria bacterium]|nr:FHA domain-containing protein [Acidobacteriota bacterium]
MSSPRMGSPMVAPRRPARDIIDAVVDNMCKNLEPLKYSTLAPSRYTVYLHASEFARLEGIIPILQEQTTRALTDELLKLNHGSRIRRWAGRLRRDSNPEIHNAAADWKVDFLADPDGDMEEGDLLIDSELILPARPELGVGERTRRITTVHAGPHTSTREQTVTRAETAATGAVVARIEYDDDAGHHAYEVLKDSITIGRGGIAYPVDVRIRSSPDVSREHARIRRDLKTGRFFLIDLSSLGTTLNGRHVPRGFDEVDNTKRENGAETALPDSARIGLADTIFLDFGANR